MTDATGSFAPRGQIKLDIEMMLAVATVALSPANFFRLDAVYFTAGDLCGVATLLVMLVNRTARIDFLGPATPLWLGSFILFLGGLLAGSIAYGDPLSGLIMFVQYAYSLLVIPIILAGRSLDETILLIKTFILSVAAIMLHGAYLVNLADNPNPRLVSPSGRLRSLIERENAAAALAAIALMFNLFLVLERRRLTAVSLIVTAVLLYGLLLTGSNSGFASVAVGTILLLLFSGRIKLLILVAFLFAGVGALIVTYGDLFLPEVFQKRVLGALSSGNLDEAGTYADRLSLIREAMTVADSRIWLGLGADQYRAISAHGAPVHNTYLLVLSEGGIFSLLGLSGLLMSGVYLGCQALRSPGAVVRGALTLSLFLLFGLLLNAFAHFYARFWHVPLSLALGLSLAQLHVKGSHSVRTAAV